MRDFLCHTQATNQCQLDNLKITLLTKMERQNFRMNPIHSNLTTPNILGKGRMYLSNGNEITSVLKTVERHKSQNPEISND